MLLQSLASNLYKGGKQVTEPETQTLRRMGLEPGTPTVYVLRSPSADPQLQCFPAVQKVGLRASASSLGRERRRRDNLPRAPVKLVATYDVPGSREGREPLLHRMLERPASTPGSSKVSGP